VLEPIAKKMEDEEEIDDDDEAVDKQLGKKRKKGLAGISFHQSIRWYRLRKELGQG
jgi:hypothetical protein